MRDPMAAFRIRLVPDRCKFAWHPVSPDFYRSVKTRCMCGLSRQRSSMNSAMLSLLIPEVDVASPTAEGGASWL